ncbi:MAG: universal stress protein [Gemmatimonadales bacterium]|jgi:nucleotide-binding universal stress UspA family protein
MLNIQTILCPTDLSDTSLKAVPLATEFARIHGADLHLLNVHLLHSITPSEEDLPFPGEADARATLESSAADIQWSQVVHHVTRGVNAAPTILDYAADHGVDLIVMGSHGRRGFRRLLLGSVTEEVVRMATCPVLVVRNQPDAPAPRDVDRILVPVDFSAFTDAQVAYAVELSSTFDVPVELVHAVEPIPYVQMSYPIAVDVEDFKRHAQRRIDDIVKELEDSRLVSGRAEVGMADDVVFEFAAESKSPLIVMSSHGHSGMTRLMLGSTTERILRRAPCPVLVTRPPERD